MSGQDSPRCADSYRRSFVQVLVIGLRLIPSEVGWNILRRLRLWEIRQMAKRLDREYQTFGRLKAAAEQSSQDSSGLNEELEVSRKQIEFLRTEIDFLKQELQNLRQNVLEKRRQKWAV
jgi:hypothetical protein